MTTEEHKRLLESVLTPAAEAPEKPKKRAKKTAENNEDNS